MHALQQFAHRADVGGVLADLTLISRQYRPHVSETNREVHNTSSTSNVGHTAATTTPVFPTATFRPESPATADRRTIQTY